MQKKKYSKPVLEVEYYTLETTIAACVETTNTTFSYTDQTPESDMFSVSAYSVCECYYSAGDSSNSISSYSG